MASGWRNGTTERESNVDVRGGTRAVWSFGKLHTALAGIRRRISGRGLCGAAMRGRTYGGPAKIRSAFNSWYARLGW